MPKFEKKSINPRTLDSKFWSQLKYDFFPILSVFSVSDSPAGLVIQVVYLLITSVDYKRFADEY